MYEYNKLNVCQCSRRENKKCDRERYSESERAARGFLKAISSIVSELDCATKSIKSSTECDSISSQRRQRRLEFDSRCAKETQSKSPELSELEMVNGRGTLKSAQLKVCFN